MSEEIKHDYPTEEDINKVLDAMMKVLVTRKEFADHMQKLDADLKKFINGVNQNFLQIAKLLNIKSERIQ
jgi:hypothetical protein